MANCVMKMKPSRLVELSALKFFRGVISEGLDYEDSGVIHQRIDPAEALDGGLDDAGSRSGLPDIAADHGQVIRARQLILFLDIA